MKFIYTLLLVFTVHTLYANDGPVYEAAGNLFPIQETQIALSKEVLNLTRDGQYVLVDVTFYFYNPDDSSRTLQMAFVTLPPYGYDEPQIEDFTVTVAGEQLLYSVRRITEIDTELDRRFNGDELLYMFTAEFKTDTTVVKHTCKIPISRAFYGDFFHYMLHTGLLWANKEIGDFSLSIDMGPNTYIKLPAFLHDSTDQWQIHGVGKIEDRLVDMESAPRRRLYLRDATIVYRRRNFRPQSDLFFSLANNFFDFHRLSGYHTDIDRLVKEMLRGTINSGNSRKCRNVLYAIHGYVFNSPEVRDQFSKEFWYIPGDSARNNAINFSEKEKALLGILKRVESLDHKRFWREYLTPFFEKSFTRLREIIVFPLDGGWDYNVDSSNNISTASAGHFFTYYDAVFDKMMFEKIENYDNVNISTNYDKKSDSIWVSVRIHGAVSSTYMRFRKIKGHWMLNWLSPSG